MKKTLIILAVCAVAAFSDRVILPAGYDNLVASKESKTSVKIYNSGTAIWSDNAYMIGGKTVNFRCANVKKITCRGTTVQIIPLIAEVSLRADATDAPIPTYDARIKVEDKTTYYKVCAAAYGGIVIDDTRLQSTTVGSTQTITLINQPNSPTLSKFYHINTNVTPTANRGGANSYISVNHQQVCR